MFTRSDLQITTVLFIITFFAQQHYSSWWMFRTYVSYGYTACTDFLDMVCTLTCWETAEQWWCLSQRWRPRLIAVTLTMLISLPCQKPSDRHKLRRARTEMPESHTTQFLLFSPCNLWSFLQHGPSKTSVKTSASSTAFSEDGKAAVKYGRIWQARRRRALFLLRNIPSNPGREGRSRWKGGEQTAELFGTARFSEKKGWREECERRINGKAGEMGACGDMAWCQGLVLTAAGSPADVARLWMEQH